MPIETKLQKGVFWFGCSRQQKRHAASPPPAGMRRRMERNRQKLVGRDKGSLTEQQTEGTATTTIQKRGIHKTNPQNRTVLSDRTAAECSRAASEFPPRRTPHRNPALRHMVWNTWLCLVWLGLGQPTQLAPSWILVKISPVLAKPRTRSQYFLGSGSRSNH